MTDSTNYDQLKETLESVWLWAEMTLRGHVVGASPLVIDAWKLCELRDSVRSVLDRSDTEKHDPH